MLEATVHYGPQELRLQQKVPEARAVDGNIGTLHVFLGGRWSALWRCLRLFIFLIIQKLVFHILFRHAAENRGGRTGLREATTVTDAGRNIPRARGKREPAAQKLQAADMSPRWVRSWGPVWLPSH